ncbi:MAG: UDP-3-O-(3-hydroxymyristoyl)glucosamine N-acyltransferase [Proteobacteria bacterium]|nr:UDP-3-O-(3-hydroxymyristoyl)glucosamine N-acyltransferase [Pseudomonadota bacterium]
MMESVSFPLTAGKLSKVLNASLVGNEEVSIERLSSLEEARSGSLSFFSNPKLRGHLSQLEAGVVVLTNRESVVVDSPITFLVVEEPKAAFAKIAKSLAPASPWKGISPEAKIHPSVKMGAEVSIGPGAIICENVTIGKGTVIYPSVYIGPNVAIGENCEIHPFVTLLCRVEMGNRVRVFSGTVIGSEGFGFLEGDSGFTEMPQIGGVTIQDDVRIGAKCTIDRSTIGNTFIGRGTKIDDQVHIGHNCRIGKNCILCAQVGLAGSSILKDGVILGGQVGVAGHLTIHENAICGGQTGVTRDLEANQKYFQCPATPLTEALRTYQLSKKLPEMAKKLKKLEEKLNG